jgi:hypothetical protein
MRDIIFNLNRDKVYDNVTLSFSSTFFIVHLTEIRLSQKITETE